VNCFEWLARQDPLRVERWDGPDAEHAALSEYVETAWLPIIGPSAVFAVRRLAMRLEESPGGIDVDVADFGFSLGLGRSAAARSAVVRTLNRMIDYRWARIDAEVYKVRVVLPRLNARQQRAVNRSAPSR
jgi:hypothetical protein